MLLSVRIEKQWEIISLNGNVMPWKQKIQLGSKLWKKQKRKNSTEFPLNANNLDNKKFKCVMRYETSLNYFEYCEWPHSTAVYPLLEQFFLTRPSIFIGEMPLRWREADSSRLYNDQLIIIMSHYVQFVAFLGNASGFFPSLHLHLNKKLTQIYAILSLN